MCRHHHSHRAHSVFVLGTVTCTETFTWFPVRRQGADFSSPLSSCCHGARATCEASPAQQARVHEIGSLEGWRCSWFINFRLRAVSATTEPPLCTCSHSQDLQSGSLPPTSKKRRSMGGLLEFRSLPVAP